MLLSARGRIPTHAERTLSAYTISKVTWRDGAPCFRGHGASVAASKGKSSCFPGVTSDRGTATVPRKSSPVTVSSSQHSNTTTQSSGAANACVNSASHCGATEFWTVLVFHQSRQSCGGPPATRARQ